jgi:hypothetical protein
MQTRALTLRIRHPTDRGQDRQVTLPAYVLTGDQAIKVGLELIRAGEAVTGMTEPRAVAAC